MHIGRLPELNITGNSTYRPPEYAVSNCGNEDTDICQLHGVLIDNVAPTVGVPINLTALAIGGFDCIPYYNFVIDGNATGFNLGGIQNYTFTTSGSHSVQVIAQCDCSSFTKWAFMNINVECPNPSSFSSMKPLSTSSINYNEIVLSPPTDIPNTLWGRWGLDKQNQNKILDIESEAYFDVQSNTWKAKIVKASADYWLWWRLLPPRPELNKPNGVEEANLAKANIGNCEKMLGDLKAVSGYSDWYMLDAIKAHEQEHARTWKSFLSSEFVAARQTIESLQTPNTCGMTKEKALSEIVSLPEYQQAIIKAIANALKAQIELPDPNANTYAAEFSVTKPLIDNIITKAKNDTTTIWPQACKN